MITREDQTLAIHRFGRFLNSLSRHWKVYQKAEFPN
jgi:hypothetical protein